MKPNIPTFGHKGLSPEDFGTINVKLFCLPPKKKTLKCSSSRIYKDY